MRQPLVRFTDVNQPRISERMRTSMSEAIPMIRVPSVWVLYPWDVSISPKLVTTQKYESFACETVIAPAPMATTTKAAHEAFEL